MNATYKQAGVNITAGNYFALMIAERVRQHWPGVGLGSFAGEFNVPAGVKIGKACTDGDGTKPDLARRINRLDVVGVDAVAMTAVDAYVDGVLPHSFLDYIVVDRLEPDRLIAVINGIVTGCQAAGCNLIGGETAEHPGVGLPKGYLDVVGFCIGFPDPDIPVLASGPGNGVKPGMKILGWKAPSLGANGFSLARGVARLREDKPSRIQSRLERYYPELGTTLGDALIMPTAIHIANAEALRKQGVQFYAHAHITGGGWVDNPPRILPDNCVAMIRVGSWTVPPIFHLLQRMGNIATREMRRVFNLGIQMISVVASDAEVSHPECVRIGEIRERRGDEPRVQFKGRFEW